MRLRHFVAASSVVLMAWLAASFLHPLPAKRSVAAEPAATGLPLDFGAELSLPVVENEDLSVSVSP